MSTLRFSDGMSINTGGTLRVIRKSDGYYVVGENMCCPVDSREDGKELIKAMTRVVKKQDNLLSQSGLKTQGEVQNG